MALKDLRIFPWALTLLLLSHSGLTWGAIKPPMMLFQSPVGPPVAKSIISRYGNSPETLETDEASSPTSNVMKSTSEWRSFFPVGLRTTRNVPGLSNVLADSVRIIPKNQVDESIVYEPRGAALRVKNHLYDPKRGHDKRLQDILGRFNAVSDKDEFAKALQDILYKQDARMREEMMKSKNRFKIVQDVFKF